MKINFKLIILSILFSSVLVGCVNDGDTEIPRVDPAPLYKESFETNFTSWVKYSKTGSQVWSLETKYGNPAECAKITGFSGGTNNDNIDWLISPAQNLSTLNNAKLSFDNAYKFNGPPIEVYISNNYSGTGNPEVSGVTWTKITGAILSLGEYKWTGSGSLNITNFTGVGNETVYIAFKYTSTSSEGSTWEIDNIKIATE